MSHPDLRVHKYGNSSWNAGQTKAEQSDLPDGFKRCSKIVDPRCKDVEGVHPLDNYRINSAAVLNNRPTIHMAACRYCESFLRYRRTREPDRIDDYRTYQRNYKRRASMSKKLSMGFSVLFDREQIYPRGALFERRDFKSTLEEGIWPEGLIVRDLEDSACYQVHGMELQEIEDRNWFEWIKEQL
jgi:hypothetical protein